MRKSEIKNPMRSFLTILLLAVLVAGCNSDEYMGRNPKSEIENPQSDNRLHDGVVTYEVLCGKPGLEITYYIPGTYTGDIAIEDEGKPGIYKIKTWKHYWSISFIKHKSGEHFCIKAKSLDKRHLREIQIVVYYSGKVQADEKDIDFVSASGVL